jgi:predicted Rossmann fold nucleotide-binding protein DprA/Smf involved in DNA uptake
VLEEYFWLPPGHQPLLDSRLNNLQPVQFTHAQTHQSRVRLHRKESDNINALAKTLNRDYKNVHADVTMLEEADLIVRDGTRLSAPWDTVTAKMAL